MKANRINLLTDLDSLALVGRDSIVSRDMIRDINRAYTDECATAIRERMGVERVKTECYSSGYSDGPVAEAACYDDHHYHDYRPSREREEDLAKINYIITSVDVNSIIKSFLREQPKPKLS